jgi:hypothetical protein
MDPMGYIKTPTPSSHNPRYYSEGNSNAGRKKCSYFDLSCATDAIMNHSGNHLPVFGGEISINLHFSMVESCLKSLWLEQTCTTLPGGQGVFDCSGYAGTEHRGLYHLGVILLKQGALANLVETSR